MLTDQAGRLFIPLAITKTLANRLIAEVAQLLGNTVAVCRKSYIHPRVLALLTNSTAHGCVRMTATRHQTGLTASDGAFLAFIKHPK